MLFSSTSIVRFHFVFMFGAARVGISASPCFKVRLARQNVAFPQTKQARQGCPAGLGAIHYQTMPRLTSLPYVGNDVDGLALFLHPPRIGRNSVAFYD